MVYGNPQSIRKKTMWLPRPIYERMPQLWLLLGLLFMSAGTYLGFDYALSFVYYGFGFFCVAWSFCTFMMRLRYRSRPRVVHSVHSDALPEQSRPFDRW